MAQRAMELRVAGERDCWGALERVFPNNLSLRPDELTGGAPPHN